MSEPITLAMLLGARDGSQSELGEQGPDAIDGPPPDMTALVAGVVAKHKQDPDRDRDLARLILEHHERDKAREAATIDAFLEDRCAELRPRGILLRAEDRTDLSGRLSAAWLRAGDAFEARWLEAQTREEKEREAAAPKPSQAIIIDRAAKLPDPTLRRELAGVWETYRRELDAANVAIPDGWEGTVLATYRGYERLRSVLPVRTEAMRSAEDRVRLAMLWPTVLHGWCTDNSAELAARSVVFKLANGESPDSLAAHASAEGRLKEAVLERFGAARNAVRVPFALDVLAHLGERDGMLELDADLADFVSTLPFDGSQRLADEMRAGFRNLTTRPRWEDWRDDPLLLARYLARALWQLQVRPILAREAERAAPAMLALPIAHGLASTFWAPARRLQRGEDGTGLLFGVDGKVLAETDVPLLDAAAFEAMQRGAEKLRSITGQRVIRHLVCEAYELHRQTPGLADVSIEGGFSGLAHQIGETSKKAPEAVRDVLLAGQAFRRQWSNGSEVAGLWSINNAVSEARGRRALLVVTVGSVLRPYWANKNLPAGERFGVPVLPLPPFVGLRKNDWAAQAVFQFLLVAELVARRLELVTDGGVRLLPADFERLAAKAGLPAGSWRRVLDRWTQDGADGPAMLERTGRDRYTLAASDPYKAARDWLAEGGRITKRGRERRQHAPKPGRKMGA